MPGKPTDCDDKDVCTDDVCDPKTGKCSNKDNQAPCDDGNACTAGDRCVKGTCKAGDLGAVTATTGNGSFGFTNGPAAKAQFNTPAALWLSASGTVLVADTDNHVLRAVEVDSSATTYAGDGQPGFVNGTLAKSRFNAPRGIAGDHTGNIYVADAGNHAIRLITANGVVGYFVGDGLSGNKDGHGIKARLHTPGAMAVDSAALYVADIGTHQLKIVTLDGLVNTLAGGGKAGFKDDVGTNALFNTPMGVAARPDGSVWVADAGNHRLRRISVTGVVTTVGGDGVKGQVDGPVAKARFESPGGLWLTAAGDLLVADTDNHRVRVVDSKGMVRPVLGDGWTTTLWRPRAGVSEGGGGGGGAYSNNFRGRRFDLPVR